MYDKEQQEQFAEKISAELDVSPGIVEYIAGIRSLCLTKRLACGLENPQYKHLAPYGDQNPFQKIRDTVHGLGYKIMVEASDRSFLTKNFSPDQPYPTGIVNINDTGKEIAIFFTGDEDEWNVVEEAIKGFGRQNEITLTVLQREGDGIDEQVYYLDDTETRMPKKHFYPQIDCELEEFYHDFLESDESVLILIGSPGMAKTTLVRGLIMASGMSATAVYDSATVTEQLAAVMRAINEKDNRIAVFEDASDLLMSRDDGNLIMQTLLNTTDGLTPQKGKRKIIFTTNLPSIVNIDEAIMRPGRCYGIINFQRYTPEQAQVIAEKEGIEEFNKDAQSNYSLADIFEFRRQRRIARLGVRRMGFAV